MPFYMPQGIFHTHSVFHSEAISLVAGKYNCKNDKSKLVVFSGKGEQ
jgi:hypothetical protein